MTYHIDTYTFHQPKDDREPIKNALEDIQVAEKKNLIIKTTPGLVQTVVNVVDIANTGMTELYTISNVYLQPLSTFAKVVTGIRKVCPFNLITVKPLLTMAHRSIHTLKWHCSR